jgi:hypothetical protein
MAALRISRGDLLAALFLLLLPVVVHLPALTGWHRFDPLFQVSVSGLPLETTVPDGLLTGYPGWVDANAGVTVEALGALAARDWLHGVLPWWNPYSGVGLPLAAESQNCAFFLPFVLLLALPHGLLLLRITVIALAGLFTLPLLRRLGCSGMPALVGASLFELNGTFAWFSHGPIMPIAFLPLLLFGIEQARDGRRWPPLAIPLGIAWSLLAGFPETAFIDGLFAFAWAALRFVQSGSRLRYAGCVIGGGLVGLMLAAPGIWPFIEALARSFLSTHEGVNADVLLPANLTLMLFPYVFGAVPMGVLRLGVHHLLWYKTGGFCDLVLVGLALIALRWPYRIGALRWLLVGWIVLTLARALGIPGVTEAFTAVPLLRQAAFHVYVLPSWSMALCVLAAFALQDWTEGCPSSFRRALMLTVGIGTLALRMGRGEAEPLLQQIPGYLVYPLSSIAIATVMLAAVAHLWSRPATAKRQTVMGAALVAHAGLLFSFPLLSGAQGGHLDVASLRYLQSHVDLGRVVSFGPLVPNYGAFFGIAEVGHNYLPVPRNWVDYIRLHLHPDTDGVTFYEGWTLPRDGLADLMRAYEATGVSYALTAWGVDLPLAGATLAWRGDSMNIWKLPDPAPYFSAGVCALTPRSRLAVEADCPAPATLRRLELTWPGWRVRIGGAPAEIVADDIFQTVALPAGRSEIAFAYAPPWINAAWAACATGAAILLAGFYGANVQRREFQTGAHG